MITKDQVFLCYNRADRGFALALARSLMERGIPVWVDCWKISGGDDWDDAIEQALQDCTHLIVVMSPDSMKSREVKGEFMSAIHDKKKVVPVMYRSCRPHRRLQLRQHIDFESRPENDADAIFELVKALNLLERLEPEFR